MDGVEVVWNMGPPLLMLAAAVLTAVVVVALFSQNPISSRPRALRPAPELPARVAERVARLQLLGVTKVEPKQFQSGRERRIWLRRTGSPVDVLITDQGQTTDPGKGAVIDRSRGGLCLSVMEPKDVGTIVKVRAAHAPDVDVWVSVEVRNCRARDGHYLLGCKFENKLSWGELLLFG